MIYSYKDKRPKIADSAFIADYVTLIGDVEIKDRASIWFGTTIRGDLSKITVGEGSNVQENSTLHSDGTPLIIEDNVTVGHGCILHGCTIKKGALIGMGATVLDGAVIGEGSLVGAGSLVTAGKIIPPNSLVVGSPAVIKCDLTANATEHIVKNTQEYIKKGQEYKEMQRTQKAT